MKRALIHVVHLFLFASVTVFTIGCGGGGGGVEHSSKTQKQDDTTQTTNTTAQTGTNTPANTTTGTNTPTDTTQGNTQGNSGAINNTNTQSGNTASDGNQNKKTNKSPASYIPQGDKLTYEMAYKFLNLTTFGATKEETEALQKKGVIAWVDEQLSYDYENNDSITRALMRMAKDLNPDGYPDDIELYMAEDTNVSFPPTWHVYTFNYRPYFFSNWFYQTTNSKKQLRLRVAYALSQIVVAADSNYIFCPRFNALAAYYDVLIKNAFRNYGDLLKDISTNPAMGYYLTFYGNRKKYKNNKGEWVYPDENYAREIMQLFSIGPYELTKGGEPISSSKNGNYYEPTYTQKDVNELARVFTGLDFRLRQNSKFGEGDFYRSSDLIHKMECFDKYHDSEEKTVLGETIPAGGTCYSDIDKAVDILIQQHNTGPFIARKLIMRLAMSNPTPAYVQRVAEVFNDNGEGVKGDLKAVVRAILLDEELWREIQKNSELKFKEPLLGITQMFRVLKAFPVPKWQYSFSCTDGQTVNAVAKNGKYFGMNTVKPMLNQGPAEAQSVFNFYSDDYVPNDERFMVSGFKAPEIQIQIDGFFVNYHNFVEHLLSGGVTKYILDPHGGPNGTLYSSLEDYGMRVSQHNIKVLFDADRYYNKAETMVQQALGKSLDDALGQPIEEQLRNKVTQALIDMMNEEFLGGTMSREFQTYLLETFAPRFGRNNVGYQADNSRKFFYLYLEQMMHLVLLSDEYMVE